MKDKPPRGCGKPLERKTGKQLDNDQLDELVRKEAARLERIIIRAIMMGKVKP